MFRHRSFRWLCAVTLPASFVPVTLLGCSSSSTASHPDASTRTDAAINACAPPDAASPSSTSDAATATCSAPGSATRGPADSHCVMSMGDGGMPGMGDAGLMVQATSQASCCASGDAGGGDGCPYQPTMDGQEGDDDDCKYHVAWTSSPICEGAGGVVFTVVATHLGTSTPVTGAHIRPEAFTTSPPNDAGCDDTSSHLSPSTLNVFAEGPPGTYTGRVVFDQAGAWTVRYHLFENCLDVLPDSPHGHAAFHLAVP